MSNHLPLLFTAITTLTASRGFALDSNQNGISDVWESLYPTEYAQPNLDSDLDGSSNLQEGRNFTNPTDPDSYFDASQHELSSTGLTLTFPGEPWMRDLTQRSPNLLDWTRSSEPVVSDGTATVVEESSHNEQGFVRRVRHDSLNSDTDSLTNKEEDLLGTDPLSWDSDGDKVADDIEFLIGTNPLLSIDSDNDSLPDDFEQWCLLTSNSDAFTDLSHINATTDFDGDSIHDGQEFTLGTSPVVPLKNVLFFITEDQSIHLGLYDTNPAGGFAGDSAIAAENRTRGLDTPHLDSLGTNGVVFDRAFCLSPVCSPSKMALFTGTFPHTNSAYRNVTNYGTNFPLPTNSDPSNLGLGGVHEDLPTLIEVFRDRGWFTAVSSKTHVQPIRKFPYHAGYPNLGTPAAAATAINDVITKAGDRPFFFWANVGSPHLPFRSVPIANGVWNASGGLTGDGGVTNVDANQIDVPNCYPDVPGVRQDIADYLGAIKVIDNIVQSCLDTLATRGVAGETLVIFTSDHGIGLHRAKQSIYSAGTQIPFIIAGSGVTGSRRTREPVSHLDVAPTLVDYIGMPPLPNHTGKSLRPIIEGTQNDFPDRETMLTASHQYSTARAVTDGRYYYVRNITKPNGTLTNPARALNTDQYQGGSPWFNRTYDATLAANGSPAYNLLIQNLTGVGLPDEELFDLDQDLWCTQNLIDNPSLATIRDHLRSELSNWRTKTEDYNVEATEMTRRTTRFQALNTTPSVVESGGLKFQDSFDGKSGNLNADPSWTLAVPGNTGADFTFVTDQLDAPGGPLTLARFDQSNLLPGSTFKLSVKTAFQGTGVGSGLAFGIVPDASNFSYWQFMLADGRSTPGGPDKDVRLIRVNAGIQSTPLLSLNNLANYATNGEFFTLEVSGTTGTNLVDLRIIKADGSTYYENLAFDLTQIIPNNSGIGLTSWSSGSSLFDDFSVTFGGPLSIQDSFESNGNLNDSSNWETLIFGNTGADFTFVASPFSLPGKSLKAGAGPQLLAAYSPLILADGKSFTAELDVAFPTSGIFGGIVFGLSDSENWFSLELGDGNSANGTVLNRLLRIRQSNDGAISNLLSPAAGTLPLIQRDRFYRITVTGTANDPSISYLISDPSTATVLASGTFDLQTNLPPGSRFGISANSSAASHFDRFKIAIE